MFPRVLLAVAILSLQSGCHQISDADRAGAIECVRANAEAMEKGDLEAVSRTIHPKSPAYDAARQQAEAIFQQYKLAFTLEKSEISAVRSDSIQVHFVMVTRKLEGPEVFTDNRAEGVHTLRRDGEQWKIWSTQVSQVRDLEGKPLPTRAAK
jgi:hypothetical protein